MLNEGGLGSQIDKMVNLNRDNPEELKKKAKVSGSLMHGLAVQELMEQLNTVKNQQALNAESTPTSVVEQMEEQLIQSKLQDKTKQIAGVMDQRQNNARQKQQSMGIATQQPQPRPQSMPQGVTPTMTAASGGLLHIPRPNLRNMAQGGIIGYAGEDGSEVDAAEAEALRIQKMLEEEGITQESWAAMSSAEKDRTARVLNISQDNTTIGKIIASPLAAAADVLKFIPRVVSNTAKIVGNTDLGQSLGIGEVGQQERQTPYLTDVAAQQRAMQTKDRVTTAGISNVLDPELEEVEDAEIAPVVDPQQQQNDDMAAAMRGELPNPAVPVAPAALPLDSDAQLQQILNTPKVDFSGISRTQVTDSMGDKYKTQLDSRMDVDPEAKKQSEIERTSGPAREMIMGEDGKPVLGPDGKPTYKELGGYDRQSKAEGLERYRLEKEELDKAALAPAVIDKGSTQSYIDGLITGGTGRTGTAARVQFDANVAKSRQDSIAEQKAGFLADMKFDTEIADKVNAQGNKVLEIYTKDVSEAMDLAANIGASDLEMYYKEAKIAYDTNQDGIKNKIDAFTASTKANLQKLIQSQASMAEVSGAANALLGRIKDFQEEYNKPLQAERLTIESELAKKGLSKERRKQLLAQIDEYDMRVSAQKEIMRADEFMKLYLKMMEELAKNGSFSNQFITQQQQTIKQGSSTGSATTVTGTTKRPVGTPAPAAPAPTGISGLGGQQTGALATLNKYAPS